MVRGAVGGGCDYAAGDRNAYPMAAEDGVEKLPIDRLGQGCGKEREQKGPLRRGRVQRRSLGKPVHRHTERDQRKHAGQPIE